MNDEAYRKRLSADLDKWIAAGILGADRRDPILKTLPPVNERPAASILAWAGAVLAGLAVIAFMAANWDFIPRFFRLLVILGVFWGALYGALWCEKNGKPKSRQASLLFAVLVFASGLGLVGQMYNLAGDPSGVLLAAGLAGLLLGAAGRSGPATATGLLFSGAWYAGNAFDNHAAIGMEDVIAALILGAGAWLARFLRSKVTLHMVIIGVYALSASLLGKAMISWRLDSKDELRVAALIFAAFWAGWAIYGRSRMLRDLPGGSTIYGYGAWFALTAYPFSGFDFSSDLIDPGRILHRLVWLAISLAAMAYGNKDNQRGVLAAGIVSLVIAVGVVMADLQLNLLVAAAIFALIAAGAFAAAGKMARNKKAAS
jgi:hypothetical protein